MKVCKSRRALGRVRARRQDLIHATELDGDAIKTRVAAQHDAWVILSLVVRSVRRIPARMRGLFLPFSLSLSLPHSSPLYSFVYSRTRVSPLLPSPGSPGETGRSGRSCPSPRSTPKAMCTLNSRSAYCRTVFMLSRFSICTRIAHFKGK